MQPNALTDGNKKVPKFRINSCRIRNRIQGPEPELSEKSDPDPKKHSGSTTLQVSIQAKKSE